MLRTTIRNNFLEAVKARDKKRADALRSLEVALKQVEIDSRAEVTDEIAVKILRGELKKREESIAMFTKANRQDLIDKESYEAETIKNYLPAQMDTSQIVQLVDETLASLGDQANFGDVMKQVMAKTKGQADGKLVSDVVREKLG
ncbi:GatB/YqeY domain-containing protein [Candidatus Beckwithbacteria bacterium]|nr:GatB/YqeY domain-containing protein [Candidatus Beckwithbacteria bacterium]